MSNRSRHAARTAAGGQYSRCLHARQGELKPKSVFGLAATSAYQMRNVQLKRRSDGDPVTLCRCSALARCPPELSVTGLALKQPVADPPVYR